MHMDITETIKSQLEENPVILYMKGSPEQPRCGFSFQTVQCLMECQKPFSYIDVLENPDIRAGLPQYSNWPTFPQLYINGELVGGCDIVTELHEEGELAKMLESVPSGADS